MSSPNINSSLGNNVKLYVRSTEHKASFEEASVKNNQDQLNLVDLSNDKNYIKAVKVWQKRGQSPFITQNKLRNQFKFEIDAYDQRATIKYLHEYSEKNNLEHLIEEIQKRYNLQVALYVKRLVERELLDYENSYIGKTQIKVWEEEIKYFRPAILEYNSLDNPKIDSLFKKFKDYNHDRRVIIYIRERLNQLYKDIMSEEKKEPVISKMNDFKENIFKAIIIPKIKRWIIYSGRYYFKEEGKWIPKTLESKIPEIVTFLQQEISILDEKSIDYELKQNFLDNLDKDNYLLNYLKRHKFCGFIDIAVVGNFDFKSWDVYDAFIKKHIQITKDSNDTINKVFCFETFRKIYNPYIDISSIERMFYMRLLEKISNLTSLYQKNQQCYIGCILIY